MNHLGFTIKKKYKIILSARECIQKRQVIVMNNFIRFL